MGLPDGEEIMTLAFFVFAQYRLVSDRRTDTLRSLLHALAQRRAGKNVHKKHGVEASVLSVSFRVFT